MDEVMRKLQEGWKQIEESEMDDKAIIDRQIQNFLDDTIESAVDMRNTAPESERQYYASLISGLHDLKSRFSN